MLSGQGWDVEADGLFGAPPITVVIGEEAHPTLIKALGLVGFGRNRLVRVPVDDQGRMQPDRLPPLSPATIVCAQAGNVNTGAFDPLPAIAERTRAAGAWLHVDGAFGLWAAAAPARAHLIAGGELADSWATDAHKWLNVPYDCGLAFVRDAAALRAAMAVTAEYLPSSSGVRNPSDYTPELSRRARGVDVWAALRCLGREGLADLVERTCRHATRFAEGLPAAGYEILNDVVLNQVLVSFGEPAATQRVIAALQADGTCWCGGTVWQGRTAMRISVSSWATTERGRRAQPAGDAARRRARLTAGRSTSCAGATPPTRPPRIYPWKRPSRPAAARSTTSSLPGSPTTCSPSGRPSRSRPAGSESAGQPSALNGFVSAFMRRVLSGPSIGTGAQGAEAHSRMS